MTKSRVNMCVNYLGLQRPHFERLEAKLMVSRVANNNKTSAVAKLPLQPSMKSPVDATLLLMAYVKLLCFL